MKLIPTILCGGAGSRLWPVSRELHPKPFMRLTSEQSLLQMAWLRAAGLSDVAEIVTVANRELFFKTADEYQEVAGKVTRNIANTFILEPFGRNTAPAIAAAALQMAAVHGEDVLMLALAADHLITDLPAFGLSVTEAMRLAGKGKIVAFGTMPEAAETGFGYIEADGNAVLSYTEKPDFKTAQRYVASGRYLWSSGMFCFSAGVMLREMEQYCPDILAAARKCIAQSRKAAGQGFDQIEFTSQSFERMREDSIDCAIMEKSSNLSVVRCNMGWSDIGSWSAVGKISGVADKMGNRTIGDVELYGVENCYVQAQRRLVGAVGVSNLIIIDTPDALLVVDQSRAQDVKHLYASLKAKGHGAHKLHRTAYRPSGTCTELED